MTAVLIAALLAFSCEKPDNPEPPKEEQEQPGNNNGNEDGKEDGKEEPQEKTYSITGPTSEFYQIEFPESAKEGETVTVTVTPVEDVNIVAVRYNSKKADLVKENVYSFEMPKKDVKITVNSSSSVTVVPSSYFEALVDKPVAEAGDLVQVVFGVYNIEDVIKYATVNGTSAKVDVLDMGVYGCSFTMPEGPVVVEAYLAEDYYVIEREWDANSAVWMLDCINNQGTPEEFCSQKEGFPVHFLYKCDLGFDVVCTVTGTETGKDYTGEIFWSLAADNHLYQDCWAFMMPDEPVVIKAVSTERNVYEGAEFVGDYTGYWVTEGDNLIYSSSQPAMNLQLKKSGAFYANTTDANAYKFSGIYTVTDGQLASDREVARGDFALRGQILEGDFAFAIIDNLLHDNVDNRRFYLTAKNGFDFVSATDKSNGGRFLLEADQNGQKTWYFVERDNQSIKKAEVTFISGNSIGQTCEAMVDVIGGMEFNKTDRFRYSYENGGAPVFTYSGKEVGTYTSDKGETLELDGFGNATYNGVAGTYTIEAGLVTYTDATGNQTKFNINMNDKTFTVIVESTGIKLDPVYSTTTAWISVDGQPSETGMITVAFDANYGATATKEGYAFIQINYMETGKVKEMIGASCPYYTDETNRTVTISNVLQGNGGWGTTKKDIVLNISEDGKTLTFVDEAIFSTVSPYIFCYGQEWAPIYSETK